jgi:hypothetical protein
LWYKNTTKPNGVNSFFGLKRDRSWFGNSTVAPTLPLEKILINPHRLNAARIDNLKTFLDFRFHIPTFNSQPNHSRRFHFLYLQMKHVAFTAAGFFFGFASLAISAA